MPWPCLIRENRGHGSGGKDKNRSGSTLATKQLLHGTEHDWWFVKHSNEHMALQRKRDIFLLGTPYVNGNNRRYMVTPNDRGKGGSEGRIRSTNLAIGHAMVAKLWVCMYVRTAYGVLTLCDSC